MDYELSLIYSVFNQHLPLWKLNLGIKNVPMVNNVYNAEIL